MGREHMWDLMRTNVRPDIGEKQRARRRQRGQSLVETAVIVPILLLLVAAVVDFGRIFDAYIVLTNAVREGARYGTLRDPQPPVDEVANVVVVDVLGSGTNITHMELFNATDNVNVLMSSKAVTVTATYDFDLWFGGIVGIPTLTVRKQAVMPMFYAE
jgi:Flp pilus assembly protein TadG